jgi:hypothetical protein
LKVLSQKQQARLISNYARHDVKIKPKGNCLIGVGYNTCRDVGFKAV